MPLWGRSREAQLPRHLPLPTGPHAVGFQVGTHTEEYSYDGPMHVLEILAAGLSVQLWMDASRV